MKTLSHPLLEVQLKDPDTLAVSPLRNFATEILVLMHHEELMLFRNFCVNVVLVPVVLTAFYSCLGLLDDVLMVVLIVSLVCFIQNSLSAIGEPLPGLVYQPLLKRKQVPGFLEEEVRYPKESLASLAHLVFVHHLAADTFPSVFR